MRSISLIVLNSTHDAASRPVIASYRRALQEMAGEPSVEVILADSHPRSVSAAWEGDDTLPRVHGEGPIGALRAGIEAASGEFLVVLDPSRSYAPSALVEVVDRLSSSQLDLAIAVPSRRGGRSWWREAGRRCLALASALGLGTSDVFSGLMAVRRSALTDAPTSHQPRGSRLVLDLLAWPCGTHQDVPVELTPDDRAAIGPVGLNDLRQLKRVVDHRFGTFSRLVQFCMVGASGMVVDLTCYALFQVLFAQFLPSPAAASASASASGVSWQLAAARASAILIALVWNFTLNRRLTFNDSRAGSIPRQFLTYALGNALGILVSMTLSLWLPVKWRFFADHKLAAAVVGIIAATGISFSMSRWVVFIHHPPALAQTGQPACTVDSKLSESALAS